MEIEELGRMDRAELLQLRGEIDALLIEQDLQKRRRVPGREIIETRRVPGAVVRLELLKYPNGSTSGPHWFRYFFPGDRLDVSVRYLGTGNDSFPRARPAPSRDEEPAKSPGKPVLEHVRQAQ